MTLRVSMEDSVWLTVAVAVPRDLEDVAANTVSEAVVLGGVTETECGVGWGD